MGLYKIYLDDLRTPKNIKWYSKIWAYICNFFHCEKFTVGGCIVCRTPKMFKEEIEFWILLGVNCDFVFQDLELSLDHDLGPEPLETGYDLMRWLAERLMHEFEINENELMYDITPSILNQIVINVHSANPVGKKNIEMYWSNFVKSRCG